MIIDTETAAGAVIYTCGKTDNQAGNKDKNNIKFLLVYSARNKEWGFAKGHAEPNETYKETAKREIFEETGISDLKFIDGFEETDSYKIPGTLPETAGRIITKKVIYYLCYTDSDFSSCKDGEISNYKWADLKEAATFLPYEQQKNLIKKAYKFITEGIK